MIITTTPNIEGRQIKSYLGLVVGEVISGADFFRQVNYTYFFDGRAVNYEDELIRTRENAIAKMSQRAMTMGANAVVGVDLDYEVLGSSGNMLMVTVSGTAVIVV